MLQARPDYHLSSRILLYLLKDGLNTRTIHSHNSQEGDEEKASLASAQQGIVLTTTSEGNTMN
jgi:hypothetical protein